jgi:hypothetical protein
MGERRGLAYAVPAHQTMPLRAVENRIFLSDPLFASALKEIVEAGFNLFYFIFTCK